MSRATTCIKVIIPALVLMAASWASADTVSFAVNQVRTGATPQGPAPYLTATFTDTGVNQVTLVLSAPGLVGSEFVSNWDFNYTFAATSPLTFTYVEGIRTETTKVKSGKQFILQDNIAVSPDGIHAGAGGLLDIGFSFPTANKGRFGAGDYSTYTITAAGLTASMFSALSGGSGEAAYSQAHIQGIDARGGSAWVTPSGQLPPVTPVPLPAAAWAGMALLGGLAVVRKARRGSDGVL